MSIPNLVVVCPPDHYALRNLEALQGLANISIGGTEDFAERHGHNADVVLFSGLSGSTVSFAQVWPHLKKVQWIHSLSAGVEKYLIPDFVVSPVPLTNARGVFKRSLADFSLLAVLYFYKRVRRLIESQRKHHWDDFKVDWIPGKVMGIVGYGEIGRECARLAHAIGMQIYAVRRRPEQSEGDPILARAFAPDQLQEMLAECDVVVAAAPLTPATRHMLSDAEFAAMKPNAVVINVGRGPVIDEAALVRALQNNEIGGAALDVFEEEPLPASSPLWDMESVLISPHCTDRTQNPDWLDLSMQMFVENFRRFVQGKPLQNVVDKRAGY